MKVTDTPTALVLTRQGLPTLNVDEQTVYEGVKRGAYVVSQAKGEVSGCIITCYRIRSLSLAIAAQKELGK